MVMQSKAATVDEYVKSLPADRAAAIQILRDVFRKNLDPVFQEAMGYGMPGYVVPHSVYPAGYHCDPKQPLPYAGMASQKNHLSLYLMGVYCGGGDRSETDYARWFRESWLITGKKLDMGKSCIRFKKIEDVPLELIAEALRRMPAKKYIEYYEASLAALASRPKKGPPRKAAKTATKKATGGAKAGRSAAKKASKKK